MKAVQTLWRSSAAVKCHRSLHFMICCFSYFLPFSAFSWISKAEKYPQNFFFPFYITLQLLLPLSADTLPSSCNTFFTLKQLSYNSVISAKGPLKEPGSHCGEVNQDSQREATKLLGQILNMSYVKIILYTSGEVKNETHECCQLLQ